MGKRAAGLLLAGLISGAGADGLPLSVQVALRQAQLPPTTLGVVVQALDEGQPRLAWQAATPLNPASLTKLVTSMAALETLGPAWQWQTPVWLTEDGGLAIQGSGDPRLSTERLWAGIRRLGNERGINELRGPLRLDRSAFAAGATAPGDFDGEPWRVGNAQPEALLLNAKALTYGIRIEGSQARITADPPLDPPQTVPVTTAACGDWRGALKLQWAPGQRPRFAGSFPAACGEQSWTLADPDPASYPARLLTLLLRDAGIAWRGEAGTIPVVEAPPPLAAPTLFWPGPTLAEALRDMNKGSSNLIAQQVLLSTARAAGVPTPSPDSAAAWLQAWLDAHAGTTPPTRLVNGSGLARETRLSPAQLAALLRWGWGQPWMPELLASLPVAGLDGTLSRQPGRFGAAAGRAHLKTGSLRDVVALAGVVDAPSGRRWVLVAIVNHPQAQAGRGVLEALLRWVAQDAPQTQTPR